MTNLLLDELVSVLEDALGGTVRKGEPRVGDLSGEPPVTSISFSAVSDTRSKAVGGSRRVWNWTGVHLAKNEDDLLEAIQDLIDMEADNAHITVGTDQYEFALTSVRRHANKSATDDEGHGVDFTITTTL